MISWVPSFRHSPDQLRGQGLLVEETRTPTKNKQAQESAPYLFRPQCTVIHRDSSLGIATQFMWPAVYLQTSKSFLSNGCHF